MLKEELTSFFFALILIRSVLKEGEDFKTFTYSKLPFNDVIKFCLCVF